MAGASEIGKTPDNEPARPATDADQIEQVFHERRDLLEDTQFEQLEPIEAGISVALSLVDLRDRLAAGGPDQQREMGDFTGELSSALAALADRLESRGSPEAEIDRIRSAADALPSRLDGVLDSTMVDVLHRRLLAVPRSDRLTYEIERYETEGEAGRRYELDQLRFAANELSKVASALRGGA